MHVNLCKNWRSYASDGTGWAEYKNRSKNNYTMLVEIGEVRKLPVGGDLSPVEYLELWQTARRRLEQHLADVDTAIQECQTAIAKGDPAHV